MERKCLFMRVTGPLAHHTRMPKFVAGRATYDTYDVVPYGVLM